MCNQKEPFCYTAQLYTLFQQSIDHYLRTESLPKIRKRPSGLYLVRELVSQWDDHCLISRWMCNFFEYLNRYYVRRDSKLSLKQVCTASFKTHIFVPLHTRLTSTILALLLKDRENTATAGESKGDKKDDYKAPSEESRWDEKVVEGERPLIKRAVQVYIAMESNALKTYRENLEKQVLKETGVFYSAKSARMLSTLNCPDYLVQAEADIAREIQLVKDVLHSSTMDELLTVVRTKLLMEHQSTIITRPMGVTRLLHLGHRDSLARLYRLYAPCGHVAMVPISEIVKDFISTKGSQVVRTARVAYSGGAKQRKGMPSFGDSVVGKLIVLHDDCYKLVEAAFQGNPLFHKALKEAFEYVVNNKIEDTSIGEMVSTRLHNILRKGGEARGMTPEQISHEMTQLIALFSYLSDKDKFAEFFRQDLAQRLLHGKSHSLELERTVIGKLKFACGAQYTSKIEGMLTDAKNSGANQKNFLDYLSKLKKSQPSLLTDSGGQFEARVLTTGFWPSQPEEHLGLPKTVTALLGHFQTFYENLYGKRRLKWIHSLAIVNIEATFNGKTFEFCMNGFQAAVLLALNDYPQGASIETLTKRTLLPPTVIKRVLLSLVLRSKILTKKPKKEYKVSDVILVNKAFTSAQRRLRVPSHVAAKDYKSRARKVGMAGVSEDRKSALEAAIVRILKTRKTISHRVLIQEVSKMIQSRNQFQADPKVIKQRIEDLMSRDYLERDMNDSETYHYKS
ncbi:hypothetical protein AAMO2058_000934600 [Amorphochlora amoebiformis]